MKSDQITVPPGWGKDEVTKFIQSADGNTYATFVQLEKPFKRFVEIDSIFRKVTDNLKNTKEWFESFFFLRSHSSYLGAIRLSTSGQLTEAYMLMRGALENALYGFYFFKKPDKRELWLKKNENGESLEKFKDEFRPVRMFGLFKKYHSGEAETAATLYDRCLDYGGHPNQLGILSSMEIKDDERGRSFTALYLNTAHPAFSLCLKTNAQVGVTVLKTFGFVFKYRYDLSGITDLVQKAGRGL